MEYTIFWTYIKNDRKESAKDRFEQYYEETMTKKYFNYLSRQVFDINACILEERLHFKEEYGKPTFDDMGKSLFTFANTPKEMQEIPEQIKKLYHELSSMIHVSLDSIDQLRMSGRFPVFMDYSYEKETFDLTLEKIWKVIDLVISIIIIESSIFYGYKKPHDYLVSTRSYYEKHPVYLRQSTTKKLINHISKKRGTKLPVFLSLVSEKRIKASVDATEFKPNPIHVKVGKTISWINTDNNSHTVTSGKGPTDPSRGKKFDSCSSGNTALTKEGKVFEHKFNSVGEFPYFCQLHPSKVGKVIVHENKIKKHDNKQHSYNLNR